MCVPSQTTKDAQVGVLFVHVLKGGCGRRFAKVNELVRSIGASHEHEAAAPDSAVVHANGSHAEDCAYLGIGGVAPLSKQLNANVGTDITLGRYGSVGRNFV